MASLVKAIPLGLLITISLSTLAAGADADLSRAEKPLLVMNCAKQLEASLKDITASVVTDKKKKSLISTATKIPTLRRNFDDFCQSVNAVSPTLEQTISQISDRIQSVETIDPQEKSVQAQGIPAAANLAVLQDVEEELRRLNNLTGKLEEISERLTYQEKVEELSSRLKNVENILLLIVGILAVSLILMLGQRLIIWTKNFRNNSPDQETHQISNEQLVSNMRKEIQETFQQEWIKLGDRFNDNLNLVESLHSSVEALSQKIDAIKAQIHNIDTSLLSSGQRISTLENPRLDRNSSEVSNGVDTQNEEIALSRVLREFRQQQFSILDRFNALEQQSLDNAKQIKEIARLLPLLKLLPSLSGAFEDLKFLKNKFNDLEERFSDYIPSSVDDQEQDEVEALQQGTDYGVSRSYNDRPTYPSHVLDWVKKYNEQPNFIAESSPTVVSETKENFGDRYKGSSEAVFLEISSNGSFWAISDSPNSLTYWLFPEFNRTTQEFLRINDFNYKTIKNLFECDGYESNYSNKYRLVYPAKMERFENKFLELKYPGKLEFFH